MYLPAVRILLLGVQGDDGQFHGIEAHPMVLVVHAPLQTEANLQAGPELHMVGKVPDVEIVVAAEVPADKTAVVIGEDGGDGAGVKDTGVFAGIPRNSDGCPSGGV